MERHEAICMRRFSPPSACAGGQRASAERASAGGLPWIFSLEAPIGCMRARMGGAALADNEPPRILDVATLCRAPLVTSGARRPRNVPIYTVRVCEVRGRDGHVCDVMVRAGLAVVCGVVYVTVCVCEGCAMSRVDATACRVWRGLWV